MDYWQCDEDIKHDMMELSDFCNKIPEPSPEPSEYMKKLRGNTSIFETSQDDELEQEQLCLPVRGHPLLIECIKRPGGKPTFNQRETSALIREVSGFGYGNDLIEHAFKASNTEDEKDPEKMKNVTFSSPSHSKHSEESDSSVSTSSEYISYSSRTSSNENINGFDIHSKKEFPDLQ